MEEKNNCFAMISFNRIVFQAVIHKQNTVN